MNTRNKILSAAAFLVTAGITSAFSQLVSVPFDNAAQYTDNFRDTLEGARINWSNSTSWAGSDSLALGNDATTLSATIYDTTPLTSTPTLFTLASGEVFTLSLNTVINATGRAVTLGMLNPNSVTTNKGVALSLFQNSTSQWLLGHRDLTSETDAFPGGANTSGTRSSIYTTMVMTITNNGLTGTISGSLFNITNLGDTTPTSTILEGGVTFANRTVTWSDYGFDPATDGMEIFLGARGATFVDNLSLTVVPEPSTVGLLALAAAGLMVLRRRATQRMS